MEKLKLSVVIPSFNEEANLKAGSLEKVSAYLEDNYSDFEVIIVDDGSTDGSVEMIERFIAHKKSFRLIKNVHGGKAIAVMTGLLESKGDIGIFIDMDQATPISELEKINLKFLEDFDIVIGSRHGREGAPFVRKLMAFVFSLFRNILLGLPFSDTQCGFKAFNKKSIEAIFPDLLESWKKMKTSGAAVNAGFDVETLFLAKKKGFKIAEVPVKWHHVGTERVQIFKDSFEAVKDVLRIKLNDINNKYR